MQIKSLLVSAALLAVVGSVQAVETCYGISNGFGTEADNQIYQINTANAGISNMHQVTLAGFTVTSSLALAANPLNGTLYAVVGVTGGRRLITIDPNTGIGTNIGALNRNFSSLAFRADGSLIGVTGDGDPNNPETLYSINTTNATSTIMFALGNGADGETIAMHPSTILYHSSGNGTAEFESINLATQVVTPLGSASGEAFAMGWSTAVGQMFLSDISNDLYTVNLSNGARTLVGSMGSSLPNDNRGLAFVNPVPEPGTVAALGLGALVLLRRRRK
jgi:hypothetical protein